MSADGTGPAEPLLRVDGLRVAFGAREAAAEVVRGLSFEIGRGECVAIVGESGSGKSVTARALLGLAGANARVSADALRLDGTDLAPIVGGGRATQRSWRRVRGARVGLVLQDALTSLDPLRPVGREIGDALRLHRAGDPTRRADRVTELLERVGVPDPAERAAQLAGELSGGLRQRALIASAIALDPPLLIADEPTTALDVTVQARILELIAELAGRGTGILLISHDLAVVSRVADRILVMADGRIVESGPTGQVLGSPRSAEARRLVAAVPSAAPRGTRLSPPPVPFAGPTASGVGVPPAASLFPAVSARARGVDPANGTSGGAAPAVEVLRAQGLRKVFPAGRPAGAAGSRRAAPRAAVDDVSLELRRGETLGLVGESGSGKSTVARLLLGLAAPDAGDVTLFGEPWSALPESARRPRRRRLGAIHQDSLGSFDPRWSVARILRDALSLAPTRSGSAGGRPSSRPAPDADAVAALLEQVGLAPELAGRLPVTLSGGQRQRVSIARALATEPDVLLCDEPVSALDVSVQAQVLDLLDELQRARGLSMLFISHDLGVVQHVSDRVAVMHEGRIVETGPTARVLADPGHPYTVRLLADAPRLSPGASR